jgi:hypothetical protein
VPARHRWWAWIFELFGFGILMLSRYFLGPFALVAIAGLFALIIRWDDGEVLLGGSALWFGAAMFRGVGVWLVGLGRVPLEPTPPPPPTIVFHDRVPWVYLPPQYLAALAGALLLSMVSLIAAGVWERQPGHTVFGVMLALAVVRYAGAWWLIRRGGLRIGGFQIVRGWGDEIA